MYTDEHSRADEQDGSPLTLAVIDAAKEGGKVRADAITALPFSAAIKELLTSTPKLATYIALAARMVGKK